MKTWPQVYSCKFFTAGLVSYEDSGAGIALLKKETIDRMLPSFVGRPVCVNHQDISPENYDELRKKGIICGNVTAVRFDPSDGWYYADFIVDTDEAIRLIEDKEYSVSCAYDVLDVVEGGTYQDIKFDGEITEGSYTHLALVENPRYEESKILRMPSMQMSMQNSKIEATLLTTNNEENKGMFKIFKKAGEQKEELTGAFVLVNGKEMPVDELVKLYNEKVSEEKKKPLKRLLNSTDIVDLNGSKVLVGEMISKVAGTQPDGEKVNEKNDKEEKKEEKENEKEEKENGKEDVKEEEKTNASDKEEKKEEMEKDEKEAKKKNEKEETKEKKENAKAKGDEFFAELQNAKQFEPEEGQRILPRTRQERAAAWAERNGNKK